MAVAKTEPSDFGTHSLEPVSYTHLDVYKRQELQQKIRPIEQKSLLVWNFPLDLKPYDICEKYWFYDISHCFKIYWDPETGKTLHYVAFHSERDSARFKRNFHGAYFNDEHTCKLLVEEL